MNAGYPAIVTRLVTCNSRGSDLETGRLIAMIKLAKKRKKKAKKKRTDVHHAQKRFDGLTGLTVSTASLSVQGRQ